MGCDIHCYIEYRKWGKGRWDSFGGEINPGRNYSLFALMADVRTCETKALVMPRGMPKDAAFCAANAEIFPEHHSHSWLKTEELREVLRLYLADGYRDGDCPEYHAIWAAMTAFEGMGYKARLVFWFDN